MEIENNNNQKKSKLLTWLKRIGFWGFLFFLFKGILWLVLGYWILK